MKKSNQVSFDILIYMDTIADDDDKMSFNAGRGTRGRQVTLNRYLSASKFLTEFFMLIINLTAIIHFPHLTDLFAFLT